MAQKKKEEEERRQREIGKFVSSPSACFFFLSIFERGRLLDVSLSFLTEEKKQRDMEEKRKYVCHSQPYLSRIYK